MKRIAPWIVLFSHLGIAQTFEVAAIHPGHELSATSKLGRQPGGVRMEYDTTTLQALIYNAYGVSFNQLDTGPVNKDTEWIRREQYAIYAKADHPTTKSEMQIMLQHLLAERFHLRVEKSKRVTEVVALTVDPHGLKIKPLPIPEDDGPGFMSSNGVIGRGLGPNIQVNAKLVTIQDVCGLMQRSLGVPFVVDKTGLPPARYTFQLTFPKSEDPTAENPTGNLILRELGLRAQKTRGEVEMIKVVHAEKPTMN